MDQQEIYKRTDEIILKFPNGKERYRKSALFNKIIQVLARGQDEYEVIDILITNNEDLKNAFEQYMLRTAPPSILIPDKS